MLLFCSRAWLLRKHSRGKRYSVNGQFTVSTAHLFTFNPGMSFLSPYQARFSTPAGLHTLGEDGFRVSIGARNLGNIRPN